MTAKMMVNGKCIGTLNNGQIKTTVLKKRSVGATTTMLSKTMQAWAARRIHQVVGVEMLEEVWLIDFEKLQHVFESSSSDWPTGYTIKAHSQYEGSYLRVRSIFEDRITLLYIDTKGNKQLLDELQYDEDSEVYPLKNSYVKVGLEEVIKRSTPEEQENLLFFLNHA